MSLGFEANATLARDIDEDYGAFIEDFESLGVDPTTATEAKPGSEDKVKMLAARYAAGMPLWHNEDCYDHGPGDDHFLAEFAAAAEEDEE